MRKFRFVVLALMIVSLIWCVFNIIDVVKKRGWIVTTATIERIGLPDGAVFGTYKDQEGSVHSGELYIDSFLQGYDTNTEKYIGENVKIIYQPQTGKVSNYDKIIFSRCISGGLLVISGLTLFILRRK